MPWNWIKEESYWRTTWQTNQMQMRASEEIKYQNKSISFTGWHNTVCWGIVPRNVSLQHPKHRLYEDNNWINITCPNVALIPMWANANKVALYARWFVNPNAFLLVSSSPKGDRVQTLFLATFSTTLSDQIYNCHCLTESKVINITENWSGMFFKG